MSSNHNSPGVAQAGQDIVPFPRIHVVVNPAAGQEQSVLPVLNEVFKEAGVDWEVSVTKDAGDGKRQALAAAGSGADLVVAYGGDGTVGDVASGLIGTGVPIGILPGGTANVMSVELGIPADLRQACQLLCNGSGYLRPLDMGEVNDRYFMLRVGIGFEAAMVEQADRELKDRFGVFAYLWSALQNLVQPEIATYRMVLDGQEIETEGLTCLIANSGNLAQKNLTLLPGIDVSDGLLDVIVIQQAGLRTLIDLLGTVAGIRQVEANAGEQIRQSVQWWQVKKEVKLTATPAQTVQTDGEILGKVPVRCAILPKALNVLVPAGSKA